MSFFDWIRRKLSGEDPPEASGDASSSRSPKERELDERLLPKKRSRFFWDRKPVMKHEEASRLFAAGHRTSDVELHRVATDRAKLQRHGLPLWTTEDDVAQALGITKRQLWYFATHRFDDRIFHYVRFRIAKRRGGTRVIMAPKRKLRAIQRQLLRELVERLPVSAYAHGFVKGRSVRTNAEPHVGKKVVVRLDLEDFFGSVTFGRVRGLLIAYGYSFAVASTLAMLMTEAERQPVEIDDALHYVPIGHRHTVQGAPTSPAVCNAIAMRLDHRLAGLARTLGFRYTRYADDMTFSGDDASSIGRLLGLARRIVEDEGFVLNEGKTRVMRHGQAQTVTGVTVNETLGLSRRERRKLRAMIHRLNREQEDGRADPQELEHLAGKLAYLAMLNPEQAEALRAHLHT